MQIKYHSSDFNSTDYPNLQTAWQNFTFTRWELLAASFTVGRSSRWDVFSHGPYSLYEMMYRSGMVFANLKKDANGNLVQTNAFLALDPSEKSAVSYFNGLTISKLMADKLMSIPYLMHLEVYQKEITAKYGKTVYKNGKSRPDLIGFDANLYPYIFEAKGRSGAFDARAFSKAKDQAQMLVSIGTPAVNPKVAVAVQAYFNSKKQMLVKWKDPVSNEQGLVYEFVNGESVIKKYYKPFFDLILNLDHYIVFKDYYTINLPLLDMTLHIPKIIEKFYIENNLTLDKTLNILEEISNIKFPIDDNNDLRIAMMKDKIIFEFGDSWKNRFIDEE
jgi:hypothetical protein